MRTPSKGACVLTLVAVLAAGTYLGRASRAAAVPRGRLIESTVSEPATLRPPRYVIVIGDADGGPKAFPAEQRTCGWLTCTAYFTWEETKQMRSYAAAAAVGAGLCGRLPCLVVAGIWALWASQANDAVGDHRCLKIKFPTMEPGTYPNGQRVCHVRG
jgi:hypothetical protein